MKNTKKFLIIFIILIVIILLILVKFLLKNVQEEKEEEEERIELYSTMEPDVFPDVQEKQDVKILGDMKTVEQCIQKYYDTININSDKYFDRFNKKIISDEQLNTNIINLLDEEFITENKINSNNLDNYIKKTDKKMFVVTLEMNYVKTSNIYEYATNGVLIDSEYNLIDKYYMYVTLDKYNNTYSIEPISEKKYNEGKLKIKTSGIKDNVYNTYETIVLGYEESIKEYINRFKKLTLASPSLTYGLLNSSYKEKKFANINNYKEYIKNNKKRISEIYITDYFMNYYDDCVEYVCTDKNGFYYIIKQDLKNCLNYEFILDTYTIENESFNKKYDNSTNQYKVGMNIDKIISAINSKDFEFMYEKLDDSFKSKYFNNAEELGKFLKNNLFDINKVSYIKFSENGNDIYTYNLKLSSYDEKNQETKDMTIIMKLLENRDFIMSFSL